MPDTAAEFTPEGIPAVSSEEARKYLASKNWWPIVLQRDVASKDLSGGDLRFDADYHTSKAAEARKLLATFGADARPLIELADVWVLPRFKRVYTDDQTKGWPYLSAEESFAFRPGPKGYLAKKYTPKDRERHFSRPGWLLMTSSGTVGQLQYATRLLDPYFLTHDLARIIPREKNGNSFRPILPGYLAACLSTPLMQSLVIPYGAVVRHIEPSHLNGILIPRLDDDEEKQVHSLVKKAWELRDEANRLLGEAIQTTEQLIRNRAEKRRPRLG